MWTPKRIMMLSGGFVLFALLYLLYSATSLGRINTLPPLPDQYKPDSTSTDKPVREVNRKSGLELKMEQAFGIGCKELKWPVLLEMNTKSMVMAAGRFEVTDDGRVILEPLSLAIFGKKKNDGRDVEINTLKCKQAYITFDRPISSPSPSELNGRKVTKAELYDQIEIVNNRRTALRDDDLTVNIPTGPLHYVEQTQFIWTNDRVHLRDGQMTPPKADITATGMEMELATVAPPPKPGTVAVLKPKNESISGVKRIVLKQDVTMHLYVAGSTPFPSGGKSVAAPVAKDKSEPTDPKAAKPPPPETSHVIIRTPGRFQYDVFKDHDMARFDVPTDAGQPSTPQDVTVERINERLSTRDQLVSKHLELRLKRRDGEAPTAASGPASAPPEQGLEIETAHATGPEVTLTSDAEKLDAHGNDFFYDAAHKLTILKGVPFMEANKEDSLIQAAELRIQDIPLAPAATGGAKGGGDPPKTFQQIQATGPGSIHMSNKATGKKTTHAFWNDKLLSTRDGELDLLVLVGSARFVDDEHEQSLKAETLKVWLLTDDKKPATAAKAPAGTPAKTANAPEPSRRPIKVEALRNVASHSREMNIHDASRLVVRFTDVPMSRMPPSTASGPQEKKGLAAPPPLAAPPTNKPAAALVPPANKVVVGAPASAPAAPPPERPIDLSARSIEAEVLRCGERSVLDHLWTEGNVKVRQDPAKPEERGIDIKGETLDMKCHPEGNVLVVTGDLAVLKMDKIIILGPEVYIDQARNKSWVYGEGAMEMESNQSLDGKPLGRSVPLTVHWSKDMLFAGEFAEFRGNIQAVQESARLACQRLQVFFDRPISLKEGTRGDQPAKVRSLVGDKDVRVEDSTVEQVRVKDSAVVQERLLKYQLFEGSSITMNTVPRDEGAPRPADHGSDANEVRLSGPGSVRILQRGGTEFTAAPSGPGVRPPSSPQKPEDQEMKLTYVSFHQIMRASNRTNTADFWGSVRVLNLPCDDPHREIDLDAILASELPPGAMYMRCNRLKVLSLPPQNGKSHQEMEAHGQVAVQAREFWAQSDHMTYNEAKDQIIFTGEGDNLAVLAKIVVKGGKPEVIRAKRIMYIRSTGQTSIDGGESFDGGGN